MYNVHVSLYYLSTHEACCLHVAHLACFGGNPALNHNNQYQILNFKSNTCNNSILLKECKTLRGSAIFILF